jgi:hypothetical protein
MTLETTTSIDPERVLKKAREFFTGDESVYSAWLESESDTHLTFGTFRSKIAVSAFPDPEGEAPTRVRVSTLRVDDSIGKFMTYIRTLTPEAAGEGAEE